MFTGPGIGVPDYKSSEFLQYVNKVFLQEFKITDPNTIFTIDLFKKKPAAFTKFAKEFLIKDASGNRNLVQPTVAHYFAKVLNDRKILK